MLRWHSLHLLSFSLSLSLGSLLFIADAEQAATRVAGSSQLVRVFVIPHTHDDPGWQQTIDEYVENYRAGSFMWRRLKHSGFLSLEQVLQPSYGTPWRPEPLQQVPLWVR